MFFIYNTYNNRIYVEGWVRGVTIFIGKMGKVAKNYND